MKYFKFAQISEETGKSWIIEQPISGPSYPKLPGMTNVIQLNQDRRFYVATADDTATPDPENYIFEITPAERAELLRDHVQIDIQNRLDTIYTEENDFRRAVLGKYDDTASIAGIYKYQQAKDLLLDPAVVAKDVRSEAMIREVNVLELAERIVANHEKFRNEEVKIAGIRGMIYDRLKNYQFNLLNPDASYEDFYSTEKIGEREEDIGGEKKIVDEIVGKYSLSIDVRFKHIG